MKEKKSNIGLVMLIIIHVIVLLVLFMFVKTEYHSDELWSYGIANSSVAGAIFEDNDKNAINLGEWLSGEVFHEYLTVQKDECFDFSATYENVKNDLHPPLTFFLTHLISSFFPDVFSFWFFIPFNILAMVLCDIYLYRTLKLYEVSEPISLVGCVLFAFCVGGINMAAYLRMYTLLTAFGMMIVYYSLKCLKDITINKNMVLKLLAINILGGLTCYEYYVFAFLVAFIICILFLLKKNFAVLLKYGFSMLGGVAIALALFPDAISDMLGNMGGNGFSGWVTYPYVLQLKMLISLSLGEVIGFSPNPYDSFFSFVIPILLIILYTVIICLPLVFFLRKEDKTKRLLSMIFDKIKRRLSVIIDKLKKFAPIYFMSIFVYLGFLMIMNFTISVYEMITQTVRYLFIVYPMVVMLICVILDSLASGLLSNEKLRYVLCVSLLLILGFGTYFHQGPIYLKGNPSKGESVRNIKDSQIILLLNVDSGLERVPNLIDRSNRFIAICYEDINSYKEKLSEMESDMDTYVVLESSAYMTTLVTDTFNQMDSSVEYNKMNVLSEKMMEDNLSNMEQELDEYFKGLSVSYSIEKIGYESTLNDGFDLYKLTKNDRRNNQ